MVIMEDNNYNSSHNWKQELAALQHDGDSFSKELAWNKLYQRLHQKKSHKKLIWYWMAAACLLIVVISFLFVHRKENTLVETNSHLKNNTIKNVPVEIPNQNNIKNASLGLNNRNKNFIHKKAINNGSDKKIFRALNIQYDEVAKTGIKNNTAMQADTVVAFIARPALVKNKLKVVHLNELGEPTPDFESIEKNKEYASSVLKFMNHCEYQIPPLPVKTGIKLFSNN